MPELMDFSKTRMQERAAEVAGVLSALSNPHRLMIMCRLAEGECNVSTLLDEVALSQSALSQHLAKLRDAGLVATRREGQTIHYRLGDDHIRAVMLTLYEEYCA